MKTRFSFTMEDQNSGRSLLQERKLNGGWLKVRKKCSSQESKMLVRVSTRWPGLAPQDPIQSITRQLEEDFEWFWVTEICSLSSLNNACTTSKYINKKLFLYRRKYCIYMMEKKSRSRKIHICMVLYVDMVDGYIIMYLCISQLYIFGNLVSGVPWRHVMGNKKVFLFWS